MSCVLLNVFGDFYISSDKLNCCFFGSVYKSEDRMGKRIIVWFSGNGKGPHVSRSVIGPFLPGLLAEARARLPLRAMGSM